MLLPVLGIAGDGIVDGADAAEGVDRLAEKLPRLGPKEAIPDAVGGGEMVGLEMFDVVGVAD